MACELKPAFDGKTSVGRGVANLSNRLDPIISEKLGSVLHGLPWTRILIELDRIAGRPEREYNAYDLQAQLKVLTRRLGNLGFPLDDRQQTAGTLGRELTIVRNAWAHGEEFTALDAWRAHDYCVRLLEYFGDDDGVIMAQRLRDEALRAYLDENGFMPQLLDDTLADAQNERVSGPESDGDEVELPPFVVSADVFTRDAVDGEEVILEPERAVWTPWVPVPVGDPDELDHMKRRAVKARVQATISEIADCEWPVHVDRVVRLVGRSFRIKRISDRRSRSIRNQVTKNSEYVVDNDGFLWPAGVQRHTWREFRPDSPEAQRSLDHISSEEIANAMLFLRERDPRISDEELNRRTLEIFGRSRVTAACKQKLMQARKLTSASEENTTAA